jgi:hypothetical protein
LVFASPDAIVAVSPSIIFDPALGPGSIFRVNITIADVSGLWGYQLVLEYRTSLLTATDFGFYPPLLTPAPSQIDDAAGTVDLCRTSYYGDSVGVTFVDPRPVAWIEFSVDGRGWTNLDLRDVILVDCGGSEIPHVAYDGYFNNELPMVPEFSFGWVMGFALLFGVVFVMLQKRRRSPRTERGS